MGIKDYLKKKYAQQKKEWAEDRAFVAKLATAKKKAYRESLLKEKVKASQEVARVETAVKLKKWKERMGHAQVTTPSTTSVRKIVKKIKGKKAKRKKFIKKIVGTETPVTPKHNADYGFYGDITRGLPE